MCTGRPARHSGGDGLEVGEEEGFGGGGEVREGGGGGGEEAQRGGLDGRSHLVELSSPESSHT